MSYSTVVRGLVSPASIVQRCFIPVVLIDHFPHVNSISNNLTNSGDVSSLTSIEQIPHRHFGTGGARSELAEQNLIIPLPAMTLHITTAHAY